MDKARKKHLKKVASWVSMALVVALLAVMPLLAKTEAEEDGPQASILSSTVEMGSVSTTLHGGGTLSTDTAEDVTLPGGVKITEFLVKNGDVVCEGDPLAAVDRVSVMTAIVEVKESMEYLEKEIESARNETVSGTVSATAGGRVKQVFAQAGDSVQDVMLEHGALAVLSLDGLMAVRVEGALPLTTGDSVTVILSDGAEAEGRVESNVDGITVITVEDRGYAIGEAVTVTDGDGSTIGAGVLYVHNAWKATAFTGTISTVYAKQEREVQSGATLFALKDTDFTAGLEYMSNQHRDYEALMQDLFKMHETGYIEAPCDGVVSGVDQDSEFLLAAGETQWEAQLLAAPREKGWTVMLLSSEAGGGTVTDIPGESQPQGGTNTGDGTGTGGTSTTYSAVAAMVKEVGSNGLILKKSAMPGTATRTETVDEAGNPVTSWTYSEGLLSTELMLTTEVYPVENPAGYQAGDLLVFLYDENGNPVDMIKAGSVQVDDGGSQFPGMGGMGGFGDLSGLFGSMMGGMSGYTGGTAAAEETVELFDLEGEVLMTVTPQDRVSLTITLDEQDIAGVRVGMEAQVKVEALRGQVFEAQVVEVSTSGTNNGGSSKFTAKLELPFAGGMLDGMSATASLPLATRMNVLTIPVEALAQDGPRTVVYTARDTDSGELMNPVEVETGLSDGATAEVLSGLEMGDAYYYSYYDILELDTSVNTQKFTFG